MEIADTQADSRRQSGRNRSTSTHSGEHLFRRMVMSVTQRVPGDHLLLPEAKALDRRRNGAEIVRTCDFPCTPA